MDVFEEMGIAHYGILLSEKDSIVYPNALAPELRQLTDNRRVHRVPDYSGATKEERVERMQQIVQIAHDNGYDSVFAGYGFMAEDEEFVATLEKAGLKFIGPNSVTQARAGKKDEAKRTALEVKVSVTPGVNDVTAAHAARQAPHPQAAAGAGRVGAAGGRPQGARRTRSSRSRPGRRRAHGLLRQGHRPLHHRRAGRAGPQGSRGHVHEVPAEPGAPQGHRRRRRQGAAHPGRGAAHPEGRRREGHRRGGGRGAGAWCARS